MNKYSVTLKQQLLVSAQAILTISIFIFMGYFYFRGSLSSQQIIGIISFIFIFDTLPSIVLHLQYLARNKKVELIIKKDGSITYKRFNKTINFSVDDINCLQYFVSYGRKTGVYSSAIYRYYKIILNDKTELIITCLMMNDIENTLEMLIHMKGEKQLKFICFLPR